MNSIVANIRCPDRILRCYVSVKMCGERRWVFICALALFAVAESHDFNRENVDASKCEAWGPGLAPTKIVFPARYFFVRLRDRSGKPVLEPTEGHLEVHISGTGSGSSGRCRVWSDVLKRSDGLHIVRYKVYNTCDNLKIDLRYENMPLGGFPMTFEGAVYSDDCYCPRDLDGWLLDMKCPSNYTQITRDLHPFTRVEFTKVRKKILEKFTGHGSISLCHYVVKNNRIFRKCYGEYVDFKIFMDAILNSLARKIELPDFEIFVNLGDWPLVDKSLSSLPVFSWCGSTTTSDIVMPTYDLTEATLECMGRVSRDMLSVQGNTGPLWEDKINKAFWRGRDSSSERLHLVQLSRNHPDIINASLTNFFFFRKQEETYGPKVDPVPFYDFFQYKYQINLDGTVAAYRLPFLLAGDSLVLKQDSSYYEHFYGDLVPNVHYVPIKKDLSNLVGVIERLRHEDEVARNISRRGQEFARENLMPKDVLCYYAVLFKQWSSRLVRAPEVVDDMEEVPQDPPKEACHCRRSRSKDEL